MNWILALVLLGSGTDTAEASSPTVELTAAESNLLQLVNGSRKAAGLPELVVDHKLQSGTRDHCSWMAVRHSMQHASGFIENIAMSQRTSFEAHRTWMNSPPHRSNILRRGVTKIGIAGYISPSGVLYWCMRVSR